MELHGLSTGRKPRVVTALTMLKQMLFRYVISIIYGLMSSKLIDYRYQGHIGAALVLGGVDATGPHLFTIHPHGSTDKLPYVTMGSGSLAAMAVFESGWKPNMDVSYGTVIHFNTDSILYPAGGCACFGYQCRLSWHIQRSWIRFQR